MNKREPTNLPASIRQRLLNLSREWNAFLSRDRLDAGGTDLAQIIQEIRVFLVKPMIAAAGGQEFEETWPAGGPWIARSDT